MSEVWDVYVWSVMVLFRPVTQLVTAQGWWSCEIKNVLCDMIWSHHPAPVHEIRYTFYCMSISVSIEQTRTT